jgi:LPS-assembly protein
MALRVAAVFIGIIGFSTSFGIDQDVPPVEQRRGNQPTYGETLPPRDQRLPPPSERASQVLVIKSFKEYRLQDRKLTASGAHFEYKGYEVRAEEVEGDLDTDVFILKGGVDILGQSEVIRAAFVQIDFANKTFRLEDGSADVKPEALEYRIQTDIYVKTREAEGSFERFLARVASVTTCSFDHPHYVFESQELVVIPDKRLTFKHFRLRILGKTILGLPRLDIPLDRNTREYLPEIGQSIDEGYFVKFKVPVAVRDHLLILKTDLMSKKGVAIGGDYLYETAKSKGELRTTIGLETVHGTLTYTAGGKHRERLSSGELDASVEGRRYQFFGGPVSTNLDARVSFRPNFTGENATTRISAAHFFNLTETFKSYQSNITVSDFRRWDTRHSTNLILAYSDSRSFVSGSTVASRQFIDVRFQDTIVMPAFSAQLDFNRAIPIGSALNFLGGVDRAPELSFRTDKNRLFGVQSRIPQFTALFSIGNFIDNGQKLQVTRAYVDLRSTKTGVPSNGIGFEYDASFRQGFYGNNTAQYTPIANVRLSYQRERLLSLNVRYNYSQQFGFTPLFIDRGNRTNVISFDALAEPLRGLKVGGQSGYDFNRKKQGQVAWQSPSLRIEYEPNDRFRFRALANYNAVSERWGNIRLDAVYRKGEFTFAASGNYDAGSGRWSSVNVFLDALKWGRLTASMLLQWNGFTNQFNSRQFSFTYDMHCSEAILQILEDNTGFQPGRQIAFYIRIKGLSFDSAFGTGRFGQPVGGGPGTSF